MKSGCTIEYVKEEVDRALWQSQHADTSRDKCSQVVWGLPRTCK
ncbi:hypothetical protein RO3G_15263 [Rhizopus delemar RA 99-880]|uniref:Uncharacterized protein n=1 Tax=Rhizopus delemar (strain RA 99-880 / ATCC MYA-4621 / FGSC 9543 / NRRL 43880) TaxID=246409 RepID=I1CQ22_RHIO9|nr:hypothetical protein RO3G_15263 [Rhizopus delemar RA 99-880]|eukprot:EIE90552.1 hypothetical protein RO3G_15263 [Rhizopus delemar RA 99-880]